MNACFILKVKCCLVQPLAHQINPAMHVLCKTSDKMQMFLTFFLLTFSIFHVRGCKAMTGMTDTEGLCKLCAQIL